MDLLEACNFGEVKEKYSTMTVELHPHSPEQFRRCLNISELAYREIAKKELVIRRIYGRYVESISIDAVSTPQYDDTYKVYHYTIPITPDNLCFIRSKIGASFDTTVTYRTDHILNTDDLSSSYDESESSCE